MEPSDLPNVTLSDLANPSIDQATLAQIAQYRPDLWAAVSTHPNCYPDLAAWIRQRTPAGPDLVAPTANSEPATAFAPTRLAAPTGLSALNVDHVPTGIPEQNTGLPPTGLAAQPVGPSTAQPSPLKLLSLGGIKLVWPPIAMAVTALLAIMTLFMPIATISFFFTRMSIGWFSEEVSQYGVMLLVSLLLVVVAAVAAVLIPKRWVWIVAGIVGALVGLVGIYIGFTIMHELNMFSVSLGAGVSMLFVSSILMVAIAVVVILKAVRRRASLN